MRKAKSSAHQKSRGTLASESGTRRKSLFSLAKPSTEPRTCWRPCRRPCISRKSDTPDGLKQAIEGRIQALANVHTLFVESRWTGAELHSLVKEELAAYCQDGEARARIDGPNLLLEPDMAQAIAVALHELATNAAKYGALSVPAGHVQVEWSRASDGRLVLRWTETGGPPVEPPTRRGFGTRVMESMIRDQLKGEMRFDWRAEGLACEIALPA